MPLGRTLLIGQSDGASGYDALCVTEQRSLEINNEEVDITKPDCTSPGSKLAYAAQYGIQTLRFSGDGAFVSSAAQKTAVANSFNQVVEEYEVTIPDVGTFVGDGLLSVTLSGDKTNEMQCSLSLTLTGAVTFTPAV